MKARTLGLLAVGTLLLSTSAGMKLAAKDLDPTPEPNGTILEQKKTRPHMDLAFCIDTTGSMQGEINMVKVKVKDLVAKLSTGKPAPIVRVGLVAFRDRGDAYVTKVYPFTDDIDKFVKDISDLKADGGGDGPESVNEALHVSVDSLSWDTSNKTAKLLFLIGDAGPHVYSDDYKWEDESRKAIAKGIQINTLACDGLQTANDGGLDVFQKIAKLTDGQFENLAYRQIVRDASGKETTVISSGGESFAVAEGARAEWKRGAKVLSSVGKAKPMMYAAAGERTRGFAGGAPSGVSAGMMKADFAGLASAPALDRKDSNLDSLMYDAAVKKAREKLNVGY
ncbi:MAG: vWA domain-containing protein [Candidatus Melainabacteria bacterium]|nr:vWA domain-containing protein [Candidatus Melainabacteria bacterium]